jgi:hypothetical protein
MRRRLAAGSFNFEENHKMSEPTDQIEALSSECEAYLASQELYSTANPKIEYVEAKLYTSDGQYIGAVSSRIELRDLKYLLKIWRDAYKRGFDAGKAAMQHEIRAVLGINT